LSASPSRLLEKGVDQIGAEKTRKYKTLVRGKDAKFYDGTYEQIITEYSL